MIQRDITPRTSQNTHLVSRALRVAAGFSTAARKTALHHEVLNNMTEALAKAHFADRVSFYHLDPFGHLHAHTSYPPAAVMESHVKDIPPEGPLKTVIEERAFIYVPDLLRPDYYYLRDPAGQIKGVEGNHLNREVTQNYLNRYRGNFEKSGEQMDMLFGSLWAGERVWGAFKADSFPSGRSLRHAGMEIEDLLNISAIVGNAASQSLDELANQAAIIKEKKDAQRLFTCATKLLRGIKHAVGGRIGIPMGYIQMLEAAGPLSDKQRIYLDRSVHFIKTLDQYLEEYLLPLKENSLEIKIEKGQTDIREILSPLLDLNYTLSIANDVPGRFATDREKLTDVIFGLIQNARKFSPDQPEISVAVKLVNREIEISVKDRGRGMTPEQVGRVFEGGVRFHQEISGSGWGLYGYREILTRLGGRIFAESEGPGQGSTFTIRLPVD